MGSPAEKPGRGSDETQHPVRLSPFFIQTTEVTQTQWVSIMGNNPSRFKGPDRPVDSVSYEMSIEFIGRLNAREGTLRYRLPTESEWEDAARSGKPAMNDLENQSQKGWFYENSDSQTHPVGQKTPNAWGLYDMQGNLAEWVYDWLGEYPEKITQNPIGPKNGSRRVIRGGSFRDIAKNISLTLRNGLPPTESNTRLGFRLVMVIE